MANVRKFDPERVKKLAEQVDAAWSEIAAEGTERFLNGLRSDTPWEERTVGDVYAAKVVELVGADKRAKRMSEAPKMFGVVTVQPRIEKAEDWEAFYQQKELEGQRRGVAIEAIAEPVPAKDGEGK